MTKTLCSRCAHQEHGEHECHEQFDDKGIECGCSVQKLRAINALRAFSIHIHEVFGDPPTKEVQSLRNLEVEVEYAINRIEGA